MKNLTKEQLLDLNPSLGSFLTLFEYFERTADFEVGKKILSEYSRYIPAFIVVDMFGILSIFYSDKELNVLFEILFKSVNAS